MRSLRLTHTWRRSACRALLLCAIPIVFGACRVVGGLPPAPAPVPARPEPIVVAAPASADEALEPEAIAARVVDVALESIGTPYEWGGSDVNGFDCSGLIWFAYGELGIRVPRTSAAQMRAGSPVAPEPGRLRPGDVLGFSDDGSGTTGHVGLYIGDGDFIHSSSSGVRISNLENPHWRRNLRGARRIVG